MKNDKRTAWGLIGLGLLGAFALEALPLEKNAIAVLRLVAISVAVVGMSMLSVQKGRSWAWGLMGYLCFLGLPVILLLPAKPPRP